MREVAVFGLGFVGLPLALSLAMRGCRVTGVDVDREHVEAVNAGVTHLHEACDGVGIKEILSRELAAGRFRATTDPAEGMRAGDVIITVGIPVLDGEPEPYPLVSCLEAVAAGLRPGHLVLVRSTLVPGMMRELVLPALEKSGLAAGEEFYLAYAPERIAEGRAFEEFRHMPVLVAGVNRASIERAEKLLRVVTEAEIVRGSSFEAVETAKLVENISRDVNIALVNELARFTRALGVSIFEVVRLANSHKRVQLLQPGPGVGGYCLPNALHYLLPRARELGVAVELLETARRVNRDTPRYVADLVLRQLPVAPAQARVGVLGLAMKDYSNDTRQSPALDVVAHLEQAGVEVRAFDPAVPHAFRFQVESLEAALRGAHGAVILARQDGIDFHDLATFAALMDPAGPFIVDTKNVYGNPGAKHPGLRIVGL
ncbi:MAG: UDP-N-acetyl-D-mannosamine dehydrogenase WecC [Clostridia bacterium 62_21]|nr:MAG: UDP-N-acetyl-D-mannosamine dehydrogenase WecC [Clostridia bacterium 62_21]HAG07309.1 nucleotide sugar dehydrogenase [Peptococcaceae bacterium]